MHKGLRAVSIATLVCFLTTQCAWGAPGASIELAGARELPGYLSIDVPAEFGTVDALYEAPSSANPQFVLHIQNAHANYQAQMKIKQLLGYMNKKYGFKTIFVEGASEKLDPDYLRLFPDEERNLKLCDELAKQGELTGAELYLMEADKDIEALGIEQAALYRSNYEALKKVFGAEADVNRFFKGFDGKLDRIASKTFTPETRELIADWKRFEQGRREFMPFVKSLAQKSKKILNVDLESLFAQVGWPQITRLLVVQQMEKELDRAKGVAEKETLLKALREKGASKELIAAVENFSEGSISVGKSTQEVSPREVLERLASEMGPKGFKFSDYPAFSLYAGYVTLRFELDAKVLFEEIEYLFTQILDTLATEPQQKTLLALYRDGELLRKLLHLELNRTQWREVSTAQDRIAVPSLVARLKAAVQTTDRRPQTTDQSKKDSELQSPVSSLQSVGDVMPPAFAKKMGEIFNAGIEFYGFARQRESVFYKEMQTAMSERRITKAVLITGGFHTDGMSDLFRENAVSYGIVTPRLSERSNEGLYRRIMFQDEHVPFNLSYLEAAPHLADLATIENQGLVPLDSLKPILKQFIDVGNFGNLNEAAIAAFNAITTGPRYNGVKVTLELRGDYVKVNVVEKAIEGGVAIEFGSMAQMATPEVAVARQVAPTTRASSLWNSLMIGLSLFLAALNGYAQDAGEFVESFLLNGRPAALYIVNNDYTGVEKTTNFYKSWVATTPKTLMKGDAAVALVEGNGIRLGSTGEVAVASAKTSEPGSDTQKMTAPLVTETALSTIEIDTTQIPDYIANEIVGRTGSNVVQIFDPKTGSFTPVALTPKSRGKRGRSELRKIIPVVIAAALTASAVLAQELAKTATAKETQKKEFVAPEVKEQPIPVAADGTVKVPQDPEKNTDYYFIVGDTKFVLYLNDPKQIIIHPESAPEDNMGFPYESIRISKKDVVGLKVSTDVRTGHLFGIGNGTFNIVVPLLTDGTTGRPKEAPATRRKFGSGYAAARMTMFQTLFLVGLINFMSAITVKAQDAGEFLETFLMNGKPRAAFIVNRDYTRVESTTNYVSWQGQTPNYPLMAGQGGVVPISGNAIRLASTSEVAAAKSASRLATDSTSKAIFDPTRVPADIRDKFLGAGATVVQIFDENTGTFTPISLVPVAPEEAAAPEAATAEPGLETPVEPVGMDAERISTAIDEMAVEEMPSNITLSAEGDALSVNVSVPTSDFGNPVIRPLLISPVLAFAAYEGALYVVERNGVFDKFTSENVLVEPVSEETPITDGRFQIPFEELPEDLQKEWSGFRSEARDEISQLIKDSEAFLDSEEIESLLELWVETGDISKVLESLQKMKEDPVPAVTSFVPILAGVAGSLVAAFMLFHLIFSGAMLHSAISSLGTTGPIMFVGVTSIFAGVWLGAKAAVETMDNNTQIRELSEKIRETHRFEKDVPFANLKPISGDTREILRDKLNKINVVIRELLEKYESRDNLPEVERQSVLPELAQARNIHTSILEALSRSEARELPEETRSQVTQGLKERSRSTVLYVTQAWLNASQGLVEFLRSTAQYTVRGPWVVMSVLAVLGAVFIGPAFLLMALPVLVASMLAPIADRLTPQRAPAVVLDEGNTVPATTFAQLGSAAQTIMQPIFGSMARMPEIVASREAVWNAVSRLYNTNERQYPSIEVVVVNEGIPDFKQQYAAGLFSELEKRLAELENQSPKIYSIQFLPDVDGKASIRVNVSPRAEARLTDMDKATLNIALGRVATDRNFSRSLQQKAGELAKKLDSPEGISEAELAAQIEGLLATMPRGFTSDNQMRLPNPWYDLLSNVLGKIDPTATDRLIRPFAIEPGPTMPALAEAREVLTAADLRMLYMSRGGEQDYRDGVAKFHDRADAVTGLIPQGDTVAELSKFTVYPEMQSLFINKMRLILGMLPGGLDVSGRKILSIGLGEGSFEKAIKDEFQAQISGFEISKELAARARTKGIQVSEEPAEIGMPKLPAASQDVVLISEAIGYLDLSVVFAEAYRVLKPGGMILIVQYPVTSQNAGNISPTGFIDYPFDDTVTENGAVVQGYKMDLTNLRFENPSTIALTSQEVKKKEEDEGITSDWFKYFKRDVVVNFHSMQKPARAEARTVSPQLLVVAANERLRNGNVPLAEQMPWLTEEVGFGNRSQDQQEAILTRILWLRERSENIEKVLAKQDTPPSERDSLTRLFQNFQSEQVSLESRLPQGVLAALNVVRAEARILSVKEINEAIEEHTRKVRILTIAPNGSKVYTEPFEVSSAAAGATEGTKDLILFRLAKYGRETGEIRSFPSGEILGIVSGWTMETLRVYDISQKLLSENPESELYIETYKPVNGGYFADVRSGKVRSLEFNPDSGWLTVIWADGDKSFYHDTDQPIADTVRTLPSTQVPIRAGARGQAIILDEGNAITPESLKVILETAGSNNVTLSQGQVSYSAPATSVRAQLDLLKPKGPLTQAEVIKLLNLASARADFGVDRPSSFPADLSPAVFQRRAPVVLDPANITSATSLKIVLEAAGNADVTLSQGEVSYSAPATSVREQLDLLGAKGPLTQEQIIKLWNLASPRAEARSIVQERQDLEKEVENILSQEYPEELQKLKEKALEFGLGSLDEVFAYITIPSSGEMTARGVVDNLLRLVQAKPGEVNWKHFFAAAIAALKGNPMMAVSDTPGGTVIMRAAAFDSVELESMATRLETNTELVEGYVIPSDGSGIDQDKIRADINRIKNTFDHKGRKIGDRLNVQFEKASKLSEKARAQAAAIKRANSMKENFAVAFLVEEGIQTTGQFNGTVLRTQEKAARQNAPVRSWLASMVALNGVDQVNQLLFKQLNDRNVLKPKGDGYEIDEALLSGLAKLWSDILTQKATSIAA
ncbi:MAG TPA: class I SAM-dependent methyltransferase [Candidatus Omnitrophota bacterium]|nr:class I SAM-dependent methyltransferase [Candidatus Omnitrophota bacterium]